MTNAEINEKVARRLGWKRFDLGWEHRRETETREDHLSIFIKKVAHVDIPNYCEDLKAAWEIIRKIADVPLGIGYPQRLEFIEHLQEYFRIDNSIPREDFLLFKLDPKAICLAFLKMEGE